MKTRLTSLFTLIVIATILLSGCGSAAAATVSASNGLSTVTKLALGTLKLEGTDQAVTSSQAAELVTLWQAYQSLSNSDTSSQIELNALINQIQGVMTSDQLKAIEGMNLNEQSLSEVIQSAQAGANGGTPASTPSASTLSQGAPAGGPGGMPVDGGAGPMGDITGSIVARSTPNASQSVASVQPSRMDARLLNSLIQLLETRSKGTG